MSEEGTHGARTHGVIPGDMLLSRVGLASMLLFGLNDHYLKSAYHNWLTGKLSDFAGLVVFPCLLISILEWGRFVFRRSRPEAGCKEAREGVAAESRSPAPEWLASRKQVAFACLFTGVLFSAIKLHPPASDLYCSLVEGARAALRLGPGAVQNVVDPSDLLALPALIVPLWLGVSRRALQVQPRSGQA